MSAQGYGTDCWKRIGFAGSKTCPNLEEYLHCRSCPVFADAGMKLFERPLSEEYARECTEILARAKDARVLGEDGLVAFRLGSERLGLEAGLFKGVFEIKPVRTIPHRTDRLLRGLTVIHGEILPLVSLRALLGIEEEEGETGPRIYRRYMGLDNAGERWVFTVDEVLGVMRYRPSDLSPAPVTVSKSPASYTRGILKKELGRINVLDRELLVNALRRAVEKR